MGSNIRPSIVLVHGAWHCPEHYSLLTDRLLQAGFSVAAVRLPSVGAQKPLESFDPDVEVARDAIEASVNRGEDVVVICHSYGGSPATEATKGLLKKDREKQGLKGGVVTMVYMCAFAPDVGEDVYACSEKGAEVTTVAPEMIMMDKPIETLYQLVEPRLAEDAVSRLQPQCTGVFASKVSCAPWKQIPCTYIFCEQDMAIGVETQEKMIGPKRGGQWIVKRLNTDHSPFLSMPNETADLIQGAIADVYA